MTDTRVAEIINKQVSEAIEALKKAKCPHCGKAIAAKVAKSASVDGEWTGLLGRAPVAPPNLKSYDDLLK